MNSYIKVSQRKTAWGFTLIELLVVIAIIALLAGLIFPVTGIVNRQKIRSKARAELGAVESMIEGYKAKLGHYPPSSPNLTVPFYLTPLYYELSGTSLAANGAYETLDRVSTITPNELNTAFGLNGLVNSMRGQGDDEARSAERFTVGLKPNQVAPLDLKFPDGAKVLVCTVGWRNVEQPIVANNPNIAPFFYNALNPTNNPNSYDLWVDVLVNGKTNRISNWSKEPIIP